MNNNTKQRIIGAGITLGAQFVIGVVGGIVNLLVARKRVQNLQVGIDKALEAYDAANAAENADASDAE